MSFRFFNFKKRKPKTEVEAFWNQKAFASEIQFPIIFVEMPQYTIFLRILKFCRTISKMLKIQNWRPNFKIPPCIFKMQIQKSLGKLIFKVREKIPSKIKKCFSKKFDFLRWRKLISLGDFWKIPSKIDFWKIGFLNRRKLISEGGFFENPHKKSKNVWKHFLIFAPEKINFESADWKSLQKIEKYFSKNNFRFLHWRKLISGVGIFEKSLQKSIFWKIDFFTGENQFPKWIEIPAKIEKWILKNIFRIFWHWRSVLDQSVWKCKDFWKCTQKLYWTPPPLEGEGEELLEKDGINLRKSFRPPQYGKP